MTAQESSTSAHPVTFDPDLVYVLLPLGDRAQEEVRAAIFAVCEELGLRPKLFDDSYGPGSILADVADLVERGEFLIFDITREEPHVFYALGYAHAVGNEPRDILLLAHAETRLRLDLTPWQVHRYGSGEELRALVRANLARMIAETRGA